MLALRKFGGLKLRVRFDIVTDEGRYTPLKGSALVFRKIPSAGMLLAMVERMKQQAIEEVRSFSVSNKTAEKQQTALDKNQEAGYDESNSSTGEGIRH